MDCTLCRTIQSILDERPEDLDPKYPLMSRVLSDRGAGQCWHKHGTFKEHLVGVWSILEVWDQPQDVCRCGLFHSAYSNSQVNLKLFDITTDRGSLAADVGAEAETLITVFCSVPRQDLVVNTLLPMDSVPADGVVVKDIWTKEDIRVTVDVLQKILVLTMADMADQFFEWYDVLFGHTVFKSGLPQGALQPEHCAGSLWPGRGGPALWMYYVSRLGRLARSCGGDDAALPPVFDRCTKLITMEDEQRAQGLYMDVVTNKTVPAVREAAKADLTEAVKYNPWIAEPRVILAQICILDGAFDEAKQHACDAMQLWNQWGTPWDKRVSFGAWVSWTRILFNKAAAREPWPETPWGVVNFGKV